MCYVIGALKGAPYGEFARRQRRRSRVVLASDAREDNMCAHDGHKVKHIFCRL